MTLKPIKVVVKNTEEILFNGEVERISSYNEIGQFDVYPMHANFISIIQKQLQLYNNKKLVKEFKLDKAVMKVKQDDVNIFLGIESLVINEGALGESQKNISATDTSTKEK